MNVYFIGNMLSVYGKYGGLNGISCYLIGINRDLFGFTLLFPLQIISRAIKNATT